MPLFSSSSFSSGQLDKKAGMRESSDLCMHLGRGPFLTFYAVCNRCSLFVYLADKWRCHPLTSTCDDDHVT